jgi:hypothetical protein
MSTNTIIIVLGVLLALASFSVRETLKEQTAIARRTRIYGMLITVVLGIIPTFIFYELVLAETAATFWESIPLGLLFGLAAFEMGPFIKRAVAHLISRFSKEKQIDD